ncbi:50S ribosomal protein L15 [bacterium]|nr:50S ribosomal protein L15 [bacterium]
MYQLNNLRPAKGAKKTRKRIGRGPGSGQGTYAGRGLNGQGSRAGGSTHPWFEGGQMPLYRRVPKRGFYSRNRVENQVVNLSQFERFDVAQEISVDYLKSHGMVSGRDPRVKILGNGEVTGAFRVKVHAVSDAARKKIETAGGTVELVPYANEARAAEASDVKGKALAKAREDKKAKTRKADDAE